VKSLKHYLKKETHEAEKKNKTKLSYFSVTLNFPLEIVFSFLFKKMRGN